MAKNPSKDIELPFPIQGIQEVGPHASQPAMSTHGSKNVVPFDTEEGRMRGGRRRGIDVVSNDTGGKVQLLDEMKVPKANITGYTGGMIAYNGESTTYDGVSQSVTSNLSKILRDPNQDGDITDSRELQGPISYIGPSNLPDNPTLPIDMYESTSIWPTLSSWDGVYTPMKSTVLTNSDLESNNLSSKYKTDGETTALPIVTDGSALNSLDSKTGNIQKGIWCCKEVDGKTATVYPRPPFDTDGSTSNPGKNTHYHPVASELGYYVDESGLAGKHVSSVLLPAADFTEEPYNSGVENNNNYAMTCSIKTPAATPTAYGALAGALNNTVNDFIARGYELIPDVGTGAITSAVVGATTYNAQITNGTFVLAPSGGGGTVMSGDMEAGSKLLSKRSIGIQSGDGLFSAERFYGFVFKLKASISVADKSVDVSAENPSVDDLLFVGFHDSPNVQPGGSESFVTNKPKLVIAKISNKKSTNDTPLADQESLFLTDIYEATGTQLPEFEHGSWYELAVRHIDGKISVSIGGTDVIPFKQGDGNSVNSIAISDYMGIDDNAESISLSRARSGLVYYSTRMAKPGSGNHLVGSVSTNVSDYELTQKFVSQGSSGVFDGSILSASIDEITGVVDGKLVGTIRGSVSPGVVTASAPCTWTLSENSALDNQIYTDSPLQGLTRYVTSDAEPSAAAQDGKYTHRYTSSGTRTSINNIDFSGVGGDWVREWSPAYFHNVTWRSADADATADSTKLTIAVSGGVPQISGDASESYVGLTGGENANLNLSETVSRVGGTVMFDRYYLVDGNKYLLIDTPKRELFDWSAMTSKDDGATYLIPGGKNGENPENPRCRLITSWLGRIVMAGKNDEPNNWFMSAIASTADYNDNPDTSVGANDWDLSATGTDGLGAIAGNSSNLAEIGDPITSLFAYRDTALVFGCTGSIFMLTNDPGPVENNAQILTLSKDIGIVSPDAWCYGPNRSLYFFGQNGLYRMAPNEFNVDQSNRLSSGRLDKTFSSIDASRYDVSLHYDYHTYGVHIFLHNKNTPSTLMESHYYYDERSNSLWEMEYPSALGPSAALSYNHVDPDKRRVLLGGYDGVIRYFSDLAHHDTSQSGSTAIDSFIWIGPIAMDGVTESKLMRIAAVLDEQSANLDYAVYVGDTAEQAKNSEAVITGTWTKGRNNHSYTRARGQSIFVKLSSSLLAVPWAIETITARIAVAGRSRDRG
tara:strand:- start:3084 stop:6719 length:3636 start_codon:yes stop_codon:yes gene_type:complete